MSVGKKTIASVLKVSALLFTLAGMVGCARNEQGAASASAQGNADLVSAGKTVFMNNGCSRCHAIGGQGGRMGPDLSRVGAEAGHTPQRLMEHVKNPRAQNPSSRMPSYEGKISDPDLRALGAYLASLK